LKKRLALLLASILVFPVLASAGSSFDLSALQAAASVCQRAGLPGATGGCALTGLQRRSLGGDVAEYTLQLRVGSGPHDVIGLHRIVRETAPSVPAPTERAIFMIHGDIWGFDAAFVTPPARSFAAFLARSGVDVWGIDLRWVNVPASTTNFAFMRDWGIEQDARDVSLALGAARAVRFVTGEGFDPMTLLGWSRGGIIGYAVVNAETQLPALLRSVDSFIPVDIYLKTNDEGFRESACRRYAAEQALLDAGTYQSANGVTVKTIGTLAATAPAGSSPVFPGLNNRQAALLTGEATFLFFPPDQQPVPSYHFAGGTFAAEPLPSGLPVPTGLSYTNEPTWIAFLQRTAPFQPNRELADSDAAICGTPDVTFDDHLAEITVPVLYVGAGGGFGEFGVYTTTLLGSTDVTTNIVDLTPPEARLLDFGHADLFLARNARALVWRPILDWLRTH
jgi:hypothetical protein